jgi:hypothetical protein
LDLNFSKVAQTLQLENQFSEKLSYPVNITKSSTN